MSPYTKSRGWQRVQAYLPVQCTPLDPGPFPPRPLAGMTEWVSGAGLALLLPETLPIGTPVLVQFDQDEPRRGHVVWIDQPRWTPGGTTVHHRVAFEQPVDPALIRQWLSHANPRHEPRAPVQFFVKFESIPKGMAHNGTCVDLSRGGMFISTDPPPPRGTQILVLFKLPNLSHELCVFAEVMWVRTKELMSVEGGEVWPSAIIGMGVRFLEVNPLEAALINTFVDHLWSKASRAPNSSASDKDKEECETSPGGNDRARDVAD